MAITLVGSTSSSNSGGGNVAVSLSTISYQQDDIAIIAYAIGDNDSVDFDMQITPGTGGEWNEIADIHAPTDTQDCDLGVFWKVMSNGETNPTAVGAGGADASVAMVAYVFRGVDATNPMDVTPTTASGNNTNRADPPSINHNNPSGLWTVIAAAFGHTSGTSVGATFPTGYTAHGNEIAVNGNDTSDVLCGMSYNTAPSDPEDPGVVTPTIADSATHSWCAVTIALRPLPPATPDQWNRRRDIERLMLLTA